MMRCVSACRISSSMTRRVGDLHHPPMDFIDIGRLLDLARPEALDVTAFCLGKSAEHIRGQIGMLGQDLVFHDHGVIDRVMAVAAQRRHPRVERVRNQRLHVGRARLDPDRGSELARGEHLRHLLSLLDRHHVGGRAIFLDVLIAGKHPCDLSEIDPMLLLQDAARPHARGDGVAAIDPDPLAFEVLRRANGGARVDENGPMMKRAHQEHRHRSHGFAVRPGADVGRDRHLADVELVPAHHAAERINKDRHFDEVEREGPRLDAAVLERLVVALRAGDGLELHLTPSSGPCRDGR
jgi:hypothetical protein